MISNVEKYFDEFGRLVLKITYPHEHNNHRPWALQSYGLVAMLVILILAQAIANITTKSGSVLGFATNITVSDVIHLTNSERKVNNLSSLKANSALSQAAALKAKDMFQDDYWDHFAPDGTSPWYFFGLVGYKYTWAGENLARDFATSSGVVSAWMDSSGHRANILNGNFTEIGVAVANGNLQGEDTTLVVQLFAKPVVAAAAVEASPNNQTSGAQPAKIEAKANVPEKIAEPPQEGSETSLAGPVVSTNLGADNISVLSLFRDSTTSQKVTISLLAMIALLFILDSVVVFRKRHVRKGSHSLAHATMIVLLIIVSFLYGRGTTI
ncbi:MAG: CAP domain-containing protein [Candidatus Woykebacteria bacterium]